MCTPFAMHWYFSTSPDIVSFECFGCQKVCKFNCFTLACTNRPRVHLFCPDCAIYHDTRLNFSCPACLLRDEVDRYKEETADRSVDDAVQPLLTVTHQRERGITSKTIEKIEKMKSEEEEKDFVVIDMEDVEDQK